jgi:hypothetical protein
MTYINDPGNEVPENKIMFYRQHEEYDHDISDVIGSQNHSITVCH